MMPATKPIFGEKRKANGIARIAIFREILQGIKPGRLLDIATGHGKFAIIAKSLGWNVTAMDARSERFPTGKKASGIEWKTGDIKEFDVRGYDCISMLGILYHLDKPRELLKRCSYATTIIDTHVAPLEQEIEDGIGGMWDNEGHSARSAFSNTRSFVPSRAELLRVLREEYAFVDMKPDHMPGRTFFVCRPFVKTDGLQFPCCD